MASLPISTAWLVPQGLERFGQGVDVLEHYFHRNVAFIFRYYFIAELLLEIVTDHEYDFAESRTERVVYRVVHDGLAGGSEAAELLETAVTASHADCQDEKSGLHNLFIKRWL